MTFLEEGNCSMNNGDYEMAIEHYERCLNVANEKSLKTIAYFSLGNAYTLSNKRKEAINCFNDCLKLSSELETKNFQHKVYLGLGSVHSTTTRLKEAIKKDEMEYLCHIALGGLNKSLGNYEKSLEHYRKGFSFIDCEHQEEEMKPRQRKESQQGNQQELSKRRERPRRPRKVGGINVGKDFVKHNLKNLSIITSAGIVSGVLAVLWELAELFDKLEQYREAADIYEINLEIVTEDEDIAKQENAMEYLIQIYDEEGRDFLKDSMTTKLQEFRERKKNQELQLQEWKYNDKSTKHKEMFLKLIECAKDPNVEVKHVDDVRVVFSEQFLLGRGSDGTRVYLGLGKDGYGKAVKRILRDNTYLAQQEEKIFNEINAKKSNYVVNYYCSRQDARAEYVHLILDLCEESLENFVLSESNSLDYLQKCLPDIFKQILKGLVDLHSDPCPILHRDLKPSNVLRDTQGKFLIADFGISRILKNDSQTYVSDANRGTHYWIAPESYNVDKKLYDKARYKPESDVMNAGMVAYFVATKGKHPFGTKECILQNLLNGKPVGLKEISNFELHDLLLWMLQLKPELRPSAKEALKHPYLLSDEEKFDLLCEVGNQPELKISHLDHPLSSDVYEQLNGLNNWMNRLIHEFDDHFNKKLYDSTWLGCLRFIQNVDQHWHDEHRTKLSSYIKEGNYKEYFVRVLPELPLLVHRIIRLNEWILRPDMENPVPRASLNSGASYQQAERPRPIPTPTTKTTPSVSNSHVSKVLTSNEDELRRYHQQRQWLHECDIVTFHSWFMKNIASSEIEKKELFLFEQSYAHIFGHNTFICDGCGINFPNRELHYHCMECEHLDLCDSCFKSKKCPKDHKLDHKLLEMRWYCVGNNCSRRITGTRFHCLVCEDFDLCLGCQETKNWPARHKESHSMKKSSTLVVLTSNEDELRRYHQQRQWLQECRIQTFSLWIMKNIASSEIEKRELFLFVRSYAHIFGHDTFTCDGCEKKFPNRKLHYHCMECEDLNLCESCFKSKKCPKDHKLDHKLSEMRWYCDGNNCRGYITGTRFHCLVCEDFDLCLECQETKNWPARHKESHSMTKSSTLVVQGAALNSGTSYQQAERPGPIRTPTTKTTPATTTCNYRKQCESFLETLNISDNYFDKTAEYNKCFCDDCHKARGDKECYTRGNPPKTYALPLGWSRFAIKIGPHGKVLNIFENWHVAFHGTQAKYLQPIFSNGLQLLMPGDAAFGGSNLREGEGHYNDSWKPRGFDTKLVFVSPSIKYAGCAVYSKKMSFTDPKTRKESIAQVAWHVLIRPGSYNVGRTTVECSQPFDSNFSDDELEWSTKERRAIIVTGLLIKVT